MFSAHDIASYLEILTGIPAPMWAAIVATSTGALIPWAVEFMVPMAEWANWRFRALTWALAVILGTGFAALLWNTWTALIMCMPALLGEVGREVLSQRWPWLSPRQEAIIVKQNALGETGVKVGDNPTVYVKTGATLFPPTTPGGPTS